MTSLGFNVCLIDDGYMTAWGDWTSLKPGRFVKDGGMRVLSDAIRAKGMKPGVWLAPFACDKHSTLAKDHPDWIIRNDTGRHANSANCGKFFYGLDATNPAVLKHVYDTIRRAVDEWGFDVLKLDFLYASCLAGNGKFDPSMSRAEAMYLGLRTIRSAAGKETFIIGCGCPIGSAVGFVDGMRVSCDTGPTFVPPFPFPHWGEQQRLLRTFPDFLTTTTYGPLYCFSDHTQQYRQWDFAGIAWDAPKHHVKKSFRASLVAQ
jgi:alpha-galactosidase